MRPSYPMIIIAAAVSSLVGCTGTPRSAIAPNIASNFFNQQTVVATTKDIYPPKSPKHIALFSDDHKPLSPYRIIGIATISKYNLIGAERQEETLNTMMKNLAASMGGDALIKVSNNDKTVKAHIIQFQRILL